MIGTYAAVSAVCGASLAIGQAALALCGQREWSWLAPGVGLALLCAVCWATVRLPGDGTVSAVVVLVLVVAALLALWRRVEGLGTAWRAGWPVALLALIAASLPFVAEGHFGILGTSFNPDMSQHLLATDRLSHGIGSQLLHQGYPLGPHAVVVALNKGLGIGIVQGFSGLTLAVSVLASLTALAVFGKLSPARRIAGALLVGVPYMAASYLAQGAFKETMQALFLLAFALSLREASRNPVWRDLPLRFVPATLIAVGSAYTYSFPGLIWLMATAVIWLFVELILSRKRMSAGGMGSGGVEDAPAHSAPPDPMTGPAALRPVLLALLAFFVLVAPEIGRMIDFHSFETFNPNGPGLGNLFGQVSPFEALGIWPSGDFRLTPGAGAVPAAGYYLGAALALALLVYGLVQCVRRRESAIVAALAAAAGAYLAARVGGTPYTASKAIEVAAPLASLAILLPLLDRGAWLRRESAGARTRVTALATVAFVLAAAGCSVLALANAPVGPASYTPALTELRPLVSSASTVVLAPRKFLTERHGTPYIAWELRGGRVCVEPEGEAGGGPPAGVRFVITQDSVAAPPFQHLRLRRRADPYVVWERVGSVRGPSDCPLIAVRQARQGAAR